MKSTILKPVLGTLCAIAFFATAFATSNTTPTSVPSQNVVVNTSDKLDKNTASWWALASSNWVLAGPNVVAK